MSEYGHAGPINTGTTKFGNISIVPGDPPKYHVLTRAEMEKLTAEQRGQLRTSHFSTCPDRETWAGKKKRKKS